MAMYEHVLMVKKVTPVHVVIDGSTRSRLVLRRWHAGHNACRFSGSSGPPFHTGITWSMSYSWSSPGSRHDKNSSRMPDEQAWYQTGSVRASLHDEVKIALRQHIAGGWDGTTVTSLRVRRYVLTLPPLPGAPYVDYEQIDPSFTQQVYEAVKRARRSARLEQRQEFDDARLQRLMQVVKEAMEATVPGADVRVRCNA